MDRSGRSMGNSPGPKIKKVRGAKEHPPNLGPFGVSCPFLKNSKFLVWCPLPIFGF